MQNGMAAHEACSVESRIVQHQITARRLHDIGTFKAQRINLDVEPARDEPNNAAPLRIQGDCIFLHKLKPLNLPLHHFVEAWLSLAACLRSSL